MISSVWPLILLLIAALSCGPRSVDRSRKVATTGRVFFDLDRDGRYSDGDRPVAGVQVFWETTAFATTGADGRFRMPTSGWGQVWVRATDDMAPGPVWRDLKVHGTRNLELPVRPAVSTGPVRFAHASDPHLGQFNLAPFRLAMEEISGARQPYHFIAVTGDLTHGSKPEEYAMFREATRGLDTPVVPVPGNHDWYDGGVGYREHLGPPTYSFDSGGVHFVVIEDDKDKVLRFMRLDRRLIADDRPTVVLFHFPPALAGAPGFEADARFVDTMARLGVDYLFTGHWHKNRVMPHERFIDYNVQPIVQGGVDLTPAGYRTVAFAGGRLTIDHHTIVESPVVQLVAPAPDSCVQTSAEIPVAAAVELGGPAGDVWLEWAGERREMERVGGWTYRALVRAETPGVYRARLVVDRDGVEHSSELQVCVEGRVRRTGTIVPWPQLQGSAAHAGVAEHSIRPPVRRSWSLALGSQVIGGSAVVGGTSLYVSIADLDDGGDGGVAALDALSGVQRWRHRAGLSTRNAPAVADGLVIYAGSDGVVRALDAETGAAKWSYDLGADLPPASDQLDAAPVIADDTVYIAVMKRFAALDLRTGREKWTVDPGDKQWMGGTLSSAAVSGDTVVVVTGRGAQGMRAYDTATGEHRWTIDPPLSVGVNASPVLTEDALFGASSYGTVFRARLDTGEIVWTRELFDEDDSWLYRIPATPALADGTLYVPTQGAGVVAIDAETGEVRWSHHGKQSVVHPAHSDDVIESFSGSPAVIGPNLWVGGADGLLRIIDRETGKLRDSVDFGVPILSGVVPAGDFVFVTTYDGTVHALVSAN